VWRERHAGVRRAALGAFLAQLAVNALWSWLFFAWRRGGLAFGEVLLLFAMVGVTTTLSWRVRPLAGVLVLPYLLWVGYATALTYSIWQRNPRFLGDWPPRQSVIVRCRGRVTGRGLAKWRSA
jgi:tryptophan-rich sensory protein